LTTLQEISYSVNLSEGIAWLKTSKSISGLIKKAQKRLSETEDFSKRIQFHKLLKKLNTASEVFEKLENRYDKETDIDNKKRIKEDFKKAQEKFKDIVQEINLDRAAKVAIGLATVAALVGAVELFSQQLEQKHEVALKAEDAKHYHQIAVRYGADENLVRKIADLAVKEKIPKDIALALVGLESEWDPDAHHKNENGTIDKGLCQLNSKYVDDFIKSHWKSDKPFNINNPIDNATIAFRHLHGLYSYFGNWKEAIMAYNAGSTRVEDGTTPARSIVYANTILNRKS